MTLGIEYAFPPLCQANASWQDLVYALLLSLASGSHSPTIRWVAAANPCRGIAMVRRPEGRLSCCCQSAPARHPRVSAYTGDGLGSRALAAAYARFVSNIQEEEPLHCSNDLPGLGDALAFKKVAMTISVHVSRTARTAVTCLGKVMLDDALQAMGMLPLPPSTAVRTESLQGSFS